MNVCLYTNCQGDGLVHFLKKSRLASTWTFSVYHNWQMIMGEQDPADLMRDAARCDAFLYQPTPAVKHGMLSTEEMLKSVVPRKAARLSFAYWYNHGFFPLIKHSGGWATGEHLFHLASTRSPEDIIRLYHGRAIHFDCARRFVECLAEQARREQACDLRLVPFILEHYRTQRLFLVENHPASPLLVECARQVLAHFAAYRPAEILDVPFAPNDANLPGGILPIHPSAMAELGLEYGQGEDYDAYYLLLREFLAAQRPSP